MEVKIKKLYKSNKNWIRLQGESYYKDGMELYKELIWNDIDFELLDELLLKVFEIGFKEGEKNVREK